MSKYIELSRALMYIADIQLSVSDASKPTIAPRDLCEWIFEGIKDLPTIEMIDTDTRDFCKRLHPTWDSGYAAGFNDGRKTERERIEVSEEELRKKYKDFYEQGKFDALVEVSEDCISREWLLNYTHAEDVGTPDEMRKPASEWVNAIKNAPSVVPSRAEGEWKFKKIFPNDDSEFPMGYLVCSVCGSQHANATPCNYCDNCGAKMKGANDEID